MIYKRARTSLGGTRVDVWEREDVMLEVAGHLSGRRERPLFLASANLDHISHFGRNGCSRHLVDFEGPAVEWLVLLDGVPLVWRCQRLIGPCVEQLAGSDLLSEVLAVAAGASARVGIFGGSPETHLLLRSTLAETVPGLVLAGCWAPPRHELDDPVRCRELAQEVSAAQVDLLVVALGKPRQEHFLDEYGLLTGARVAVAFGAAIDFLAGRVERAPVRVRQAGLEWLWRLLKEPRRLARRYLVAGPPGALALLRDSRLLSMHIAAAPDASPSLTAVVLPDQRRSPGDELDRDRGPSAREAEERIPSH